MEVAVVLLSGVTAAVVSALFSWLQQRNVARLSAELQRSMKEHEVRFSYLHVQRSKVIANLYRHLLCVHSAYMALTYPVIADGDPPREEKERVFSKCWAELLNHFNLTRIYLDQGLCDQVASYVKAVDSASRDYGLWRYHTKDEEGRNWPAVEQQVQELYKKVGESHELLVPILKHIEARFRDRLGADN